MRAGAGTEGTSAAEASLAAAASLLAGLLVLALRPGVPLDEVRYLQILSESRGFLQLSVDGRPYLDKPPLPFWLARAIAWTGLDPSLALRALPALGTAATVWLVGRLARRLGVPYAAAVQAALLLPFLYGQYLLVDPLFVACIWAALVAWSERRDGLAAVAAAAAGLTKGPVAWLFLAPLFWAARPLRGARARALPRALAVLASSLAPLALWAGLVGVAGGAQVREDLWWGRWAGRVRDSFAHVEPPAFYLPVLMVGLLPLTPLFILGWSARRSGAPAPVEPSVAPRGMAASLLVLVVFSAMSGKQPHYLLPLFPVAALALGSILQRVPAAPTWLRFGAAAHAACVCAAAAAAFTRRASVLERYGDYGRELAASWDWIALLLATTVLAGLAALVLAARPWAPRAVLGVVLLVNTVLLAPVHVAAGRVGLPARLAAAVKAAGPETPVAIYGQRLDGLLSWSTRRNDLEHCDTPESLRAFGERSPGGLVIAVKSRIGELAELGLEHLLTDQARGWPIGLFRVTGGS